jgi:pyrimidine 5'-nucleotidase
MRYHTIFFDLDDTLYPSHTGLWEAILTRMHAYMHKVVNLPEEQLSALRQQYLETYGTTLRGLQHHYHVNTDEYLAYVHDLPLQDYIQPDPLLRQLLLSLPQQRWIFTNSDINHARRVLNILGAQDCFEGIIDVHAIQFQPKPTLPAYQVALQLSGAQDASGCVLLDDAPRNLAPAREMGFFTILVGTEQPHPSAHLSIPNLHHLPQAMPELWESNGHGPHD